jgi:hypothetical protein
LSFVADVPVKPWRLGSERLNACFDRIEKAANTYGQMRGNSSDSRPYRFSREESFFDAVNTVISFAHEGDDYLRYSVRIEEYTLARRRLAVGPTGLIDVRDGLGGTAGQIDAAFGQIIAFLDANVQIITRADPARPPGLSDMLAELRRFFSG